MSITVTREPFVFKLSTRTTDYAFSVSKHGRLVHLHYGAKVTDTAALAAFCEMHGRPSFQPTPMEEWKDGGNGRVSLDSMMQEYSGFNVADYRVSGVEIRWSDGSLAADPRYVSHRILNGKPALEGLPASFAGDDPEVATLEVVTEDAVRGVRYVLLYSVFPKEDVITRSVRIENATGHDIRIERVMSSQLDLRRSGLDILQLPGAWARERRAERLPLPRGIHTLRSLRGATGHSMNSAFAVLAPDATETAGEVYGFEFCYSGNFEADIESDTNGTTRISQGICPDGFSWLLKDGESFQSPEAFLTFSSTGLSDMTAHFHDFIRAHLISPHWATTPRPVLVNNWEATYFDFNSEKIYSLAKDAAALGIEMLVMDDGWFGKNRNGDKASLGDWYANPKKIGDLPALVAQIHSLGIKFGLWFEPEMVSEDSDLYRAHPDWVLSIPGRQRTLGRNEMVLDFSRPEIVDAICDAVVKTARDAKVDYIKYDMNRNHSEVFSAALPPERQGEVAHRFVLGLYRFHQRLVDELPGILIEGCSGGGGRFDPGMLFYTPQIWCSDDTDAIERLRIQLGTSLFYPCSAMGAHVSASPNHQIGRTTGIETRATVALAGTFGYELDITRLSADDRARIPAQIGDYHRVHPLVLGGDFHRLSCPYRDNWIDAWMFVSRDKSEAFLAAVCAKPQPNAEEFVLRLRGLDPKTKYEIDGKIFYGDTLMNAGLPLAVDDRDADSRRFFIRKH